MTLYLWSMNILQSMKAVPIIPDKSDTYHTACDTLEYVTLQNLTIQYSGFCGELWVPPLSSQAFCQLADCSWIWVWVRWLWFASFDCCCYLVITEHAPPLVTKASLGTNQSPTPLQCFSMWGRHGCHPSDFSRRTPLLPFWLAQVLRRLAIWNLLPSADLNIPSFHCLLRTVIPSLSSCPQFRVLQKAVKCHCFYHKWTKLHQQAAQCRQWLHW